MSEFDLQQWEKECYKSWKHLFEVDATQDAEKYYITVAYPYPSGAMHVGHGRTYIVPDVIARFWRMKGKCVLYPMAFHVTGTPVIGISRRIAQKDYDTIRLYCELYKVPEDVLERFVEPMEIVRYFSQEYERVMRRCALSIDWRRRFTTVDPQYSKFIEWQYQHLHDDNLVVRGAHPVKYCPQCDNPVGDHDLLEGDKAEIIGDYKGEKPVDVENPGKFMLELLKRRPMTINDLSLSFKAPKSKITALINEYLSSGTIEKEELEGREFFRHTKL